MVARSLTPARVPAARRRPRLALVALPWAVYDRPSAALGALLAWVRRERPRVRVEAYAEYVHVMPEAGAEVYEFVAADAYRLGELAYMPFLYPERAASARAGFVRRAIETMGGHAGVAGGHTSWEHVFDHLHATLDRHLDEAVARIAPADVVGLTTSYGQLFANLAFCRRLREKAPGVITILGGSTVSARVGPSLLAEYSQVDVIVQGEGERPLVALLDAAENGGPLPEIPGVLSRGHQHSPDGVARMWEVERLDDLPVPDYDHYQALAEERRIDWTIPMEGSRGCWWDRGRRTGDPRQTCYFCSLNVQWNGYREKSAARVVRELDELSERYDNTRFFFLDNIVRARGVTDLAEGLLALGRQLELFYEARVNIRPHELLALRDAGLTTVQFGIEALLTSYLRRIGKGTRLIQNLQAMKLCSELKIHNAANLLVGFPGATEEEVEETRRVILTHALAYQPLVISHFRLNIGSTVEQLPKEFGVAGVRNLDAYRDGLPEEVWQRLPVMELDHDEQGLRADWTPVVNAVKHWQARQAEVHDPLLTYFDGGTFLTIIDRRVSNNVTTLRGGLRELYLYCGQVRTRSAVETRFGKRRGFDPLKELEELARDGLVFAEGAEYLSLALARRPEWAASRIKAASAQSGSD